MKHFIYCSESGCKFDKEVPSLNADDIKDALRDILEEYINEEIDKEECRPCGFFPEPDEIACLIYGNIRDRLLKRFACLEICGRTASTNGCSVSSGIIDISLVISELIEERGRSEQSYIDAGGVIIGMLTNFLIEGIWHFGLADENGSITSDVTQWPKPMIDGSSVSWKGPNGEISPIIWFGVEGQDPIECWSITLGERMFQTLDCYANPYDTQARPIERWKLFWFSTFWCFDWNALFDNNGNTYIVWMFAECGMDEPIDELCRVRAACPIELNGADTGEMLAKKINAFFIKTQEDTLMKG